MRSDDPAGTDPRPTGPAVSPETFREALSHWGATVAVVAVREPEHEYGVTVTSFTPISADPPHVLISLGPSASVIPFLERDRLFGISLLNEDQRRIASVMADSYPVGPSPFDLDEPRFPLVSDAVVGLGCRVVRVVALATGVHLVVARVDHAAIRPEARPLLYHRRGYVALS